MPVFQYGKSRLLALAAGGLAALAQLAVLALFSHLAQPGAAAAGIDAPGSCYAQTEPPVIRVGPLEISL